MDKIFAPTASIEYLLHQQTRENVLSEREE